MPTIELSITGDEAPTAVTLLTLTRTDTGAAVAGAPGAFTDAGGGEWTRAFTAPATGLTYSYTFRLTWSDATTTDQSATFVDPVALFTGRYTTTSALKLFIGAENAEAYGDTGSDGVAEAGAFQQAIEWGEADVDHHARGPLTVTIGSVGASLVQKWATVMAAKHLHHKRPLTGDSAATYASALADVMREMHEYAAGVITLAGVSRATSTVVNYPVVANGSEADLTLTACGRYPFVCGL